MKSILDESLREWLTMAIGAPRTKRFTIYTTAEVMKHLEEAARRKGWTRSRVAHLAILFGLAALVKYWEEEGEY
jgi:hypothetical protein